MARVGSCRWAFLRTASGPESGSVTGIFGSTTDLLSAGWNSLILAGAGLSRLPFWAGAVAGGSVQPVARSVQAVAAVRKAVFRRCERQCERGAAVAGMLCSDDGVVGFRE